MTANKQNKSMGTTKAHSTPLKTTLPHPVVLKDENAANMVKDLQEIGLSYDEALFTYIYCMPENKNNAYRAIWMLSGIEDPSNREKNTLRVRGHNMTKRPFVQKGIEYLLKKRAKNLDVMGEDIIKDLLSVANANPLNFMEMRNGQVVVKDLDEIPESLKSCIKEINQDRDGIISLKFYDRMDAIKQLTKIIGLDVATMKDVGDDYADLLKKISGEDND